jgi:AcrR family transcriptional regulator
MSNAPPTLRLDGEPDPPESAKERLLAAAERLLADGGFEAASVRAVTQAAGMSVSAAHYHFGSKETLVQEVFRRRLGPLNAIRLARLDALNARADATGELSSVEAILEAFIRPGFEVRSAQGPDSYRLLAARLHGGPSATVDKIRSELLEPSLSRFLEALAVALPERDPVDLALAVQFVLGAMLHVIAGPAVAFADGQALDEDAIVDRLVRFGAAGVRAASERGGSR